jgi:hypothetical protein
MSDEKLETPEYEPPRAEDMSTEETPSVTAAGKSNAPGAG